MASHQPKHVLVEVLVFTTPGLKPRVVSYWDPGTDISGKPIAANIGDRIGWTVILVQANRRVQIPYTVSFFNTTDGAPDSSFFGVNSLAVTGGGLSDFLTVRSLIGKISYRIEAPGYGCLLDPDIQSGDSSALPAADALNYWILWDTTTKNMTCTQGGVNSPFPITVRLGDTVTFTINQGSEFEIDFPPEKNQNLWASPFKPFDSLFESAAGLTIGPLAVIDEQDPSRTSFWFVGDALDAGGQPVESNPYEIKLA
jgi:hypothetical protein